MSALLSGGRVSSTLQNFVVIAGKATIVVVITPN